MEGIRYFRDVEGDEDDDDGGGDGGGDGGESYTRMQKEGPFAFSRLALVSDPLSFFFNFQFNFFRLYTGRLCMLISFLDHVKKALFFCGLCGPSALLCFALPSFSVCLRLRCVSLVVVETEKDEEGANLSLSSLPLPHRAWNERAASGT